MWDPPPVLLYTVGALHFHAAYITYQEGIYPIDRHLGRMSATDVVILISTWHRIGYQQARLQQDAALPCHVVLCANTPEDHAELLSAGVDAIYCNQNAWLNYTTIFTLNQMPHHGDDKAHEAAATTTAAGVATVEAASAVAKQHCQPLFQQQNECEILPGGQTQQQQLLQQQLVQQQPGCALTSGSGSSSSSSCGSHAAAGHHSSRHQQHHQQHHQQQLQLQQQKGEGQEASPQDAERQWSSPQQQEQQQQQQPHSKWDVVVNSNSSAFKRSHLSCLVANRVHISYSDQPGSTGIGPESSPGTCINIQADGSYRYLSPEEVAAVLNRCHTGGIFSAEEGPCYACTEYLLCGLPVITTASRGGRHVWLTPENSITVEATPAAVAAGVELALQKLASGEFDKQKIRQRAVEVCEWFRAELVNKIEQKCIELGAVGSDSWVGGVGGTCGAAVPPCRAPAADLEGGVSIAAGFDAEGLLQLLTSRHKLGLL